MVKNVCELIGLCLGSIGLIGISAVTGLPMWRVTAFIQENIIVMETRWEGLWMNCYRQANIRMQCKVYDSLLYLPAELQAARGLMCCSVALSFVGLLISLPGLSSTSCLHDQKHIKYIIIAVAGSMEIAASICVFIPVSWTAHSIISDFYNPLLIDAQRRELGDALYIGWVAGFLLFCSGVVFLSCQKNESHQVYQQVSAHKIYPVSPFHATPNSVSSQIPLIFDHESLPMTYSSYVVTPGEPTLYNVPVVYPANMVPAQQNPSLRLSIPRNTLHTTVNSTASITDSPRNTESDASSSTTRHTHLTMSGYQQRTKEGVYI